MCLCLLYETLYLPALYSLAECFPAISVPAYASPRKLESMKGKCEYYRPNTPVRYARGFTRVAELLTVRVAGTFRLRLISYFGRKNYYLARKGEYLINPAAQQYIISQAEALGLRLDDYFDEYVERYDW